MAKVTGVRIANDMYTCFATDDDQRWFVNPEGDIFKGGGIAHWDDLEGAWDAYEHASGLLMDAVVDVNAKLSKRFGDEVPFAWNSCPKCGSKEIEGDSVEICAEQAMQECSCRECGGKWLEVYEASHRVELDREEA